MALKSETESPPNDKIVIGELESGTAEDLEDGEIFDDEPDKVEDTPPKGVLVEEKVNVILEGERFGRDSDVKKNKGSSGGGDRKKCGKDGRDLGKRSNSSERKRERSRDRGSRNNTTPSRRKRTRESEDEHKPSMKIKQRRSSEKKSLSVEEEVDESEMIYVRGGNSPTTPKANEWERFNSDEEVDRERDWESGSGRGRRGRESFHGSARASRRARFSRGGLKRRFSSRKSELTVCKFFMQGKCQRGNDCPFSHSALPSKKMELCKFYMNDCCTKKDKCLYMHSDFPCKFFHTGLKCYAGKRCRFYHGKINSVLRSVLNKHLERGDLQMEHENMKEQFVKKSKDRGSRFDRPDRRRSPDEDEGSTPMPSPQRDHFSDREESRSPPHRDSRRRKRRSEQDYFGPEGDEADDGYNEAQESANFDGPEYNSNENQSHEKYENEEEADNLPVNLPRTQRKLFKRIQQQQKNTATVQMNDNRMDDDPRDDNWYSSDEETGNQNSALNTIYRNLPGLGPNHSSQAPPPPVSLYQHQQSNIQLPNSLPDIDTTAISKLLSTLKERMHNKRNPDEANSGPKAGVPAPPSVYNSHPPVEENRPRDPRLRMAQERPPLIADKPPLLPLQLPLMLTQSDLDLRMSDCPGSLVSSDIDLRHLPFKPAPVHQAANEIDASLNSHPPIEYRIQALTDIKADYSAVAAMANPQTCANDPRLRRFLQNVPQVVAASSTPPVAVQPRPTEEAPAAAPLPRDPRTRALVNDPRIRRAAVLRADPRQQPLDVDLRTPAPHHVGFFNNQL